MIRKLIAALLIVQSAQAGLPPTTTKGQSQATAKTTFGFQTPFNQATLISGTTSLLETGNSNVLANPGFEGGSTGWTASGGATAAANATALGTGAKGYDWDSNAAAQTLRGTAFTIPAGLAGKNGVISCNIKVPSGAATHTFGTWDGTTYTALGTITSSTSFARTTFNFIFGAAGTTVTPEILSVASNEPEIYVDDCILADAAAVNLAQVAQAAFVGSISYAAATNCQWTTTSASFATFAADTDCSTPTVTGDVSAPATKIPGLIINNRGPGRYLFIARSGAFAKTGGANETVTQFRITDGTISFGEQGQTGGASSSLGYGNWEAGVSYTDSASNVSFTFQGKTGSNTASINADSSSGFAGFEIEVYRFPTVSETIVRNPLNFYPTYTAKVSSAGVVTDENSDFINGNCSVANTSEYACTWNAGIFSAAPNCTATGLDTSTASPIVKVFTQAGTTSVVMKTYNNSATATAFAFNLSCQSQTAASAPAPILVGSVTSSSVGAERIERGETQTTCSAATCTLTSSTPGVSNVTRSSAGNYSINFVAGAFSGIPVCFITPTGAVVKPIANATNTSTAFGYGSYNDSGVAVDSGMKFLCMGPK